MPSARNVAYTLCFVPFMQMIDCRTFVLPSTVPEYTSSQRIRNRGYMFRKSFTRALYPLVKS